MAGLLLDVHMLGAQVLAQAFRDEVKLFQLAKRKQMREAGNLLKRDVVARVRGQFPITRPRGRGKAAKIGPLYRFIKVRVRDTAQGDVVAIVGPSRRAFYGRFLETGLDTQATRGRRRILGITTRAGTTYRMHLAAKPFLEPVAKADEAKVLDIIGDSYSVFVGGRRV